MIRRILFEIADGIRLLAPYVAFILIIIGSGPLPGTFARLP
jgi:hypothetical protein